MEPNYGKLMTNSNATPNQLTPIINQHNVTTVREMIEAKQNHCPFYATSLSATSALTDIDHHPYSRFWRGSVLSDEPIIMEREAGWRPRNDACYKLVPARVVQQKPNHCFEAPCSTVHPCYPAYMKKIADADALAIQLNDSCIVQYR